MDALFNVDQHALEADGCRDSSVATAVISLLNTYAGLSLAIAGFVLDEMVLVIGGLILVVSASVLIRWPGFRRTRKGDQCEPSHPSKRPLMP
jgi:hypothetical protein